MFHLTYILELRYSGIKNQSMMLTPYATVFLVIIM